MKKFRFAALAAVALVGAGVASPALAGTTIILNGVESIGNAGARKGYQIAAKYWESVLTNDATVAFNVGFASLAPDVLAQASSNRTDVRTKVIYDAMMASGNSALDATAMASLTAEIEAAGGNGVNMRLSSVDLGTGFTFFDDYSEGDFSNNEYTYANTSVLKALGLIGGTGVDAAITFSSDYAFDFNPANGVSGESIDFIGVAIHEMGHGLGFVSDVDFYDFLTCPSGPACGAVDDMFLQNYGGLNSTLDLFRYNGLGELDWSVGANTFFSIDGGLTQYNGSSRFSTGAFNGDLNQASHWKAPVAIGPNGLGYTCSKANRIGVMNPYLCDGQDADITNEDIAAFDAMGWNVSFDVLANPTYSRSTGSIYSQFIGMVPEPSTWAMMILGFGVAGAAMRRKTKAQARLAI